MKLTLLTLGTRGDVAPFVALGKGLARRGHEVTLGAPDNFEEWVGSHGLGFHGLGLDMQEFLRSPEVRGVVSGNRWGLVKVWRRTIVPAMRRLLDAAWEAGRGADAIVYHPKAYGAVDVAEATGAAAVCASLMPLFTTGEFPPLLWRRDLGPRLNRLAYRLFDVSRLPYLKILDRWRREALGLGKGPALAPLGGLAPRLCAVSKAVVPRPADWDEVAYMTGYWFLDEGDDWTPDGELAAFLDAGEPPIYVGFGSMTTRDPRATARQVVEGLRRAGLRAVLATGWGALAAGDLPEGVHAIEGAPHHRLFERVRAVVHHGGAGTTAAGLRAGLPTLVCPLIMDQPFWGRRVHALGCGPEPLPLKTLAAADLAARLRELVSTPAYRHRAEKIARQIAVENGVARAVEVVEAAASDIRYPNV